jgi:glycosyltransferase involved in cell wall biosynthesis
MKKLIREINPDIIELWEEPFSAVTAQAIHAARKINPDIKIIFFSAQNIRKKYPPPFSWFERYTHRHADFAFVMNRDAQEILQERGWQKGSIVLPLGVNPNRFKRLDASTLRKRLGLNKFTIGFIGKLDRQKGVPDLVKAFGMLKDEANLLIIGEGPMAGPLRNLIDKLDISADSRIIPPVPYSEIPEYLNCMDVLVLPSVTLPGLKEQFGRVLIEAMSCEVPVIGSSSGEIPAIIGDAGLVFPERDLETLLHRLRTIINNPADARDLSRRSRERVLRKYDWKIIARKQIEIYSTLMAPSSSGKGD